MLAWWRANVMRSKVEPMKEAALMVRKHFDGIAPWTQTRQTSGILEALNGLLQAAKRKTRGYTRLAIMRTVLPDRRQARLRPHQPACRIAPLEIQKNP